MKLSRLHTDAEILATRLDAIAAKPPIVWKTFAAAHGMTADYARRVVFGEVRLEAGGPVMERPRKGGPKQDEDDDTMGTRELAAHQASTASRSRGMWTTTAGGQIVRNYGGR